METRQYILRPNTVLWVEALQKHVTNANITDDIAVTMLNKNRGYAKYFEKLPVSIPQPASAPVAIKPQAPLAPAVKTTSDAEAKELIKKAILESVSEMTLSELKEYCAEREEQFPEWKKHKAKQKLLDYIVSKLA